MTKVMMVAVMTVIMMVTNFGTTFAQDSIVLDLSKMKGTPVAMEAEPLTNGLVLSFTNATAYSNISYYGVVTNDGYRYTNSWISTNTCLSVDGVVRLLRNQGDITNLIKNLAESGDVCAVVGHKWDSVPHVTLEYRSDGNYPEHRKCATCGKSETKEYQPAVWK